MSDEKTPIYIEEEGYVTVIVGQVEQTVDLWKTNNRLVEIIEEAGDDTLKAHSAIAEFMESLGYPLPSHRTASAFATRIFAETEKLKKKEPQPASASAESKPD